MNLEIGLNRIQSKARMKMSDTWIDLRNIDELPEYELLEQFNAVDTLTLGELIEGKFFDLSREDWQYDYYSIEQRDRLNSKIVAHYYYREISTTTLKHWKMEFLRTMNEIMPKYKLVYEMVESGLSPIQIEDRYTKYRNIYSDFPQTMLSGINQDYASNGHDYEGETIVNGSVSMLQDFVNGYKDVDALIIDELESLFSPFISMNMNGL